MGDWAEYPNFTEREFACKGENCCGGKADMDNGFMFKLSQLRKAYGKPMVITSGFRCPKHNQVVSSSGPNGPHTTGRAADIKVSGKDAYRLVKLAMFGGFTGIGVRLHGAVGGRYVHLDDLGEGYPRPAMWSY